MKGQITITDYMSDRTHRRDGSLHDAPAWMDKDRCENCRYWEILPVEQQPPSGWGVKGQCNCSHEPEMMEKGYWTVSSISYCDDFERINLQSDK